MQAIVIFHMQIKQFGPHDMSKRMPANCHKASLGTFNGPHAMTGARRAAERMQEAYDANPEPHRYIRTSGPLRDMVLALARAGKLPSDFAQG